MIDIVLVSVLALLCIAVGALFFYNRRLRRLTEEYTNAKTLVDDIIISFNNQVRKQEEKVAAAVQKTMATASRSGKIEGKLEDQETQVAKMATEVNALTQLEKETQAQLTATAQKVTEATRKQDDILGRITDLEERAKKIVASETSIEAVIPIKQEKALAAITPTELSVLEILASEGQKTAPEIKVRVNLTREHTARLMKKLYEEGYLERTTGKIPFAYSVKEEMRKILKRAEANA
ncbi:MAG TPA: MarR family transcriptional regulator [Candidatus Bathyarchaeia archaeon]|nr:MarR family transcriptional regulator [Candidatus Bathyarchaeia archaeon]